MQPTGMIERATRWLSEHATRTPGSILLGQIRQSVAERTLARYSAEAERSWPGLAEGAPEARAELADVAERALSTMRSEVDLEASHAGLLQAWAALMDARWRETYEGEYLDDPSVDHERRVRILEHLDAMNDLLDTYRGFFEWLRPMLCEDRTTRLLELAAGHGGFALALARRARDDGLDLELLASDIKQEYLDLGAARARSEELDVHFGLQDALDLGNLEPGSYDVLMCMQSLHHFPAGEVAVMFTEAARVAARGVLFFDGTRSSLAALGLGGLGLFRYGDRDFVHDAMVSFRRFFVAEELELLARLSPWGAQARAQWIAPGHCVLALAKQDT
jgi:ubiquinone/menaquinone biosynthesis C-methylase UbiE